MIDNELARAIVFSTPLVVSLVCLVLTVLDMGRDMHPILRKIHRRTILTYGIIAVTWCDFVLYEIAPATFMQGRTLFLPLIMATYVLVYRLARTITDSGKSKLFSCLHYVGPAAMFAMMILLEFVCSGKGQELIAFDRPECPLRYISVSVALVYSFLYPVLCLVEIWRYRQKHAGVISENTHGRVLDWIFGAIIVEMIMLPVPVYGLFLGWKPFSGGGFVWMLAVLPTTLMYIVFCRNVFSDNYIVVEPEEPKITSPSDPRQEDRRQRVEHYFETKKPYLNPDFRITDLAEELYTNRAYMSAFINKEYGMNFNRFVNGYRLREVERLREEAAQKKQHVSSLQLILNAGFNSYRSYLRANNAKNQSSDTADDTSEDEQA